jgi:hypothetical protein
MKNQYFGDINDYRKYGILRALAGPPLRLVVSWMLTPDDGRSDGKSISYLSEPDRWEETDPGLFHFLKGVVHQAERRQVSALVASEIIPSARYVNTILDGSPRSRESWLSETISLAGPDTLVFFDPDNGLEVKSVSKGSRDSSKYLYWDEVERAWSTGSSLLIYQHFTRENRETFLRRLADQFRGRLGVHHVSVLRTANVAFFLVPQKNHVEILHRRAEQVDARWKGQIGIENL